MKQLKFVLPLFLAGILLLSACTGVQTTTPVGGTLQPATVTVPVFTETSLATATEAATATLEATEVPSVTPTQTATSIVGIPATGGDIEALTEMMRYRAVDNDGNELGLVRDFVINTCQAHILYIVMDAANGSQSVLIPYEAVSRNPNRPADAANDALVVNFDASLIASVPLVDLKTVDFESSDWDAAVMAFWKQKIATSLTTACNVASNRITPVPSVTATSSGTPEVTPTGATLTPPAASATPGPTEEATPSETPVALSGYQAVAFYQATVTPTAPPTITPGGPTLAVTATPSDRVNVYKVGLASDLIGANVVDIRGNMLAKVRDALILKNTGGVQFYIVQLVAGNQQAADGNMVALPPGAVNLFYGNNFASTILTPAASVTGTVIPQPTQTGTLTPEAAMPTSTASSTGGSDVFMSDRLVFLLLVDGSLLRNAPAVTIVDGFVDQATLDYWNAYFPRPTAAPTSATPGVTSTPVPSLTPTP